VNESTSFSLFSGHCTFFLISLGERTLNDTLFFQSHQLVQIEAERSKHHFHMSSNDRSHVGMSVMENILDDGIGSLTGRSFFWIRLFLRISRIPMGWPLTPRCMVASKPFESARKYPRSRYTTSPFSDRSIWLSWTDAVVIWSDLINPKSQSSFVWSLNPK